MAYRINEWLERYEVNDKGGVWRPGQPIRSGSIDFIRAPVHGKNWTPAFREFNEVCGADAPMVYGVFCKLRELQADNRLEYRDALRDHKGRYLDADGIARVLGWPTKTVTKALGILSGDVLGWLTEFPGVPRNSDSDQIRSDQVRSSCAEPPSDSTPATGVSEIWHPTTTQPFLTHSGPYEVDDADIATWLPAIACNDERGWPLTRLHLQSLLESYQPALDGVAAATEVKKAKAWLLNNPANRKTPLGMPKFLNNWLSKAVNGGKR